MQIFITGKTFAKLQIFAHTSRQILDRILDLCLEVDFKTFSLLLQLRGKYWPSLRRTSTGFTATVISELLFNVFHRNNKFSSIVTLLVFHDFLHQITDAHL
jgi:hypothetical protein